MCIHQPTPRCSTRGAGNSCTKKLYPAHRGVFLGVIRDLFMCTILEQPTEPARFPIDTRCGYFMPGLSVDIILNTVHLVLQITALSISFEKDLFLFFAPHNQSISS
jgi:hypothetical protein